MKDFRRRKRSEGHTGRPTREGSPSSTRAQETFSTSADPANPSTTAIEPLPLLGELIGGQEAAPENRGILLPSTRSQRGTFSTFTVSLPSNDPSAGAPLDVDPVGLPAQLEQILGLCDAYHRWLLGPGNAGKAPVQVAGPWNNQTSQMLLFAVCLKSIGHLESLKPGQVSYNRRLLKTKVLSLVNRRLQNPAKALDDKTLGALACLASYEAGRHS
jgi:hypothetical protein